MFSVIDHENGGFAPIKSGFATSAQANKWCRKNLPADQTHLWGKPLPDNSFRYFVIHK